MHHEEKDIENHHGKLLMSSTGKSRRAGGWAGEQAGRYKVLV
jgi:hypothetical protein